MAIKGIGRVGWSFKIPNGILTVYYKCYIIPNVTIRLLSLQHLFCEANNIKGNITCTKHHAALTFDDVGILKVDYDPNNHLTIAVVKNFSGTQAQINLTVLDKSNQNLTAAQKLLLVRHVRFRHKGFASL